MKKLCCGVCTTLLLMSLHPTVQAQTFRADLSLSDPAVMADPASQAYYMTGTGGDIFKSVDLEIWEKLPWAINTSGIDWIGTTYTAPSPGQVWAPELYYKDGIYYDVVTFTNPNAKTEGTNHSRRSIHILKSDRPEGPYSKIEDSDALYLPASKMAIDGTIWEEDGKLYLVYVYEWVQAGDGAMEYIELKPDLTGTVGESHTICRASDGRAWNNSSVTDGPFIFRTQTGRLGMIWTSWRDGVYVQGVSYSDNGRLDGNWSHEPMPVTPDNHGHGMMFRTFDGQLLMSIHSNRNIDLDAQHFERHPVFFVMDDSGDELRAVMEYRPIYDVCHPAQVVIRNAGMDYSTHGWTCNSDAVNQGIASNQSGAITGKYYECWDAESFTGEIFQELALPNGTYKLTAAAFRSYPAAGATEDDEAVCLFANEDECHITSSVPEEYSVVVHVTNGRLRFGLRSAQKAYQWMGIDNVSITYYGTEEIGADELEQMENGEDAIYLMHKQTGQYFNCGQSWGTQAVLGPHPLDLYLVALPEGKYAIDTKIKNGDADHYVGANGYLDAPFVPFLITMVDSATCTLSANSRFWGSGGANSVIRTDYTSDFSYTRWVMKKKSDLLADFRLADTEHPADATFLIRGGNFGRNDTRVARYWKGYLKAGGDVVNQCAEAPAEAFDIYQELSGVPNGFYELYVQGFYRDGAGNVASERKEEGAERLPAVFYANEKQVPVMSVFEHANDAALPTQGVTDTPSGRIPATLEAASAAFSAGLYTHKLLVEVTDGTMRLGVRKTNGNVPADNWTVFDNFELYYLGTERPSAVKATEATENTMARLRGIYDLCGRKVSDSTEHTDMLQKGVYIVNGKKILISR